MRFRVIIRTFLAIVLSATVVGLFSFKGVSATVPGLNERVSVSSSGVQGDNGGGFGQFSEDGRYVVFASGSTNLVANDTNGKQDIFVRDRNTNTTTRVSVDSNGVEANDLSDNPQISNDGRYVVFNSPASNLVSGDTNFAYDVFLHDRQTGTTQIVSTSSTGVIGNGNSQEPAISGDGRFVVFSSGASNLTSGTFSSSNIFVKDLLTGITTLLTHDASGASANGYSVRPSISCDGGVVTFYSNASNLVPGDTNAKTDVFVVTRAGGDMLTNITMGSNGGAAPAQVSCNGLFVAFSSISSNLVASDTNAKQDVFRYDRRSGTTTLVSVDSSGTQSNGVSTDPFISGDGRYVVFGSDATNLITSDTNANNDVFVRDTKTGSTQLISINSASQQGNGYSSVGSIGGISSDGKYVAYLSTATNLVSGDTNGATDTFVSQTGF